MNEIAQSDAEPPNDNRVGQAIGMLWSADDSVRNQGLEETLGLGPATVQPLIELLCDLIRNPYPRFASGKEQEGHKLLEDYEELIRGNNDSADDSRRFQTAANVVINSRLISDAVFLLGELRAVEAIPVLINIMENRSTETYGAISLEMDALRKIGPPAIPSLVKSIKNAKISAERFEPIIFGFIIETDSEDNSNREVAEQPDDSTFDDVDFERTVELDALSIKRKALKVLGEIRAKESLPFLENLAREVVDDQELVFAVSAAIRTITGEVSTSNRPPVILKPSGDAQNRPFMVTPKPDIKN